MSFDLSSTTSSDEGSVVDISALLPDRNETKALAEPSTSVEHEPTTKNQGKTSKPECSSHLKEIDTKSRSKSLETIGKETKNDDRTMRIVVGESVKTWQRQRNPNLHRTDKTLEPNPKYITIQSSNSSSNSKVNFEKSRLEVQKSMGGKTARVDIIETKKDEEKRQSTKLCKPPSSSAFVDCVAIWDPQRQVYTLEIPELIATSDIRLASLPDEDDQNPKKRQRGIGSELVQNRKQRLS